MSDEYNPEQWDLVGAEQLQDEIERLQHEIGYMAGLVRQGLIDKESERNTVIEKCAKTIEDWPVLLPSYRRLCEDITAAIRALKEKP